MKVIQEDREVVADWYRDYEQNEHLARMIERRQNDNALVHTVARYRIAAFEAGARAMQEACLDKQEWIEAIQDDVVYVSDISAIDLKDLQYD